MTVGTSNERVERRELRDAPPSVDVVGHLRDLRRAAMPATIIGILVFLAVFGVRTWLTPAQYEATAFAQITTADAVVGGDAYIEQLRAPFVGLAKDPSVQDTVLAQFDIGWDRGDLTAHTTLSAGTSPTILVVTVRADTPELAGRLAGATVNALDQASAGQHSREVEKQVAQVQSAIDAARARTDVLAEDNPEKSTTEAEIAAMVDQMGRLQVSGGTRLELFSQPTPSDDPVAPKPVAEGLVAGLVAAIVAAELIVFLRGRAGSAPTEPWARRMARRHHLGYGRAGADPSGLSPNAAMVLNARGGTGLVLVGPLARVDVFRALPADTSPARVVVADLGSDWWTQVDFADLMTVVVVLSVAGRSRAEAEQVLTQLAELSVPVELVLQDRATAAPATS